MGDAHPTRLAHVGRRPLIMPQYRWATSTQHGGSHMAISRVALIFDSIQRPETTGGYCLRALKQRLDVEHFQPGDLARIPSTGFDLYLNIDDGLRYRLPRALRPSAWWAIDTHMDLAWCTEKSRDFDLVFAAQRDGAEALRRAGVTSATWLPLAAEPEIHKKHDVPIEYDVAFVGNIFPGPRQDLLELIRARFARSFIGQRYFHDMALTYSAARLLDETHLRFFTRREIEKLFFRAGYAIQKMSSVVGPGDHDAIRNGSSSIRIGRTQLDGLSARDASEFSTYQHLVRARPNPVQNRGLTSIVIVTHNELEYTRQCLSSVQRLTDEPYELIVVDNGSTDGTVDYLRAFPCA